jgi:UBX domain-containing protein 1
MIDDNVEEFRTYDTPEAKKFMKDLSEGYVPTELRQKHPQGIDVALEDKRGEEYKLPPYMKFKGTSTSIGGPAKTAPVTSFGYNPDEGKPHVDNSKPTTTIQIRFHNGQRSVLTVNEDCTIDEILNYVAM